MLVTMQMINKVFKIVPRVDLSLNHSKQQEINFCQLCNKVLKMMN